MGSGGTEWESLDTISKPRMNQKTLHIGTTEPPIMYLGMVWIDTTLNLLKMRNAANTAWIIIGRGKSL